jgi:hypothetical protein
MVIVILRRMAPASCLPDESARICISRVLRRQISSCGRRFGLRTWQRQRAHARPRHVEAQPGAELREHAARDRTLYWASASGARLRAADDRRKRSMRRCQADDLPTPCNGSSEAQPYSAIFSKGLRGMLCMEVIVCGQTSKGAGDLSHRVVAKLGHPGVLVHGVALKPAKPLCSA